MSFDRSSDTAYFPFRGGRGLRPPSEPRLTRDPVEHLHVRHRLAGRDRHRPPAQHALAKRFHHQSIRIRLRGAERPFQPLPPSLRDHRELLLLSRLKTRPHRGRGPTRKPQQRAHRHINFLPRPPCECRHPLRLPQDPPRHAHRVTPHVEQRPTPELLPHPKVRRIPQREPKRGINMHGFANARDELARPRMEPVHERLHEQDAGLLGDLPHLLRLARIHAQRLLAQHVLPRGRRPHRPLLMHAVMEWDIDNVHLRVCKQRLISGADARYRMLSSERPRASRIATGNRHQPAVARSPDGGHHGTVSDPRGAQHPPPDTRGSGYMSTSTWPPPRAIECAAASITATVRRASSGG